MSNCGCGNKARATNPTNPSNTCLDCDVGPFARNNYFTGKLLVERDFKDEQAYYVDKALLHNRQLHGCGVVCGLRVTQHEAENCRARYVCIEPGAAIDCCGHEIVVPERECIDITQLPAVQAIKVEQDPNGEPVLHRVQICLRYRECPTEEIPVLYGECGCDDAACAPNRILESYDVDVLVDEPDETASLLSPGFERKFTIPLGEAVSVALDEAGGGIYVLAGETGGTISRVSLDDGTISPQSHTMPAGQKCEGILLSEDGKRLYAAMEPTAAGVRRVTVMDTANLAGAPVRTVDVPDSANSLVYMAVAGGRLLTLASASGKLHRWATALDAAPAAGDPPLTPEATVDLGFAGPVGLAVSGDGKSAYTLDPTTAGHRVLVADLSASPPAKGADLDLQVGGASALAGAPVTLAVVQSTGPDRLAVATNARELRLMSISPTAVLGTVTGLAHKPVAMVTPSDGQWAYVLEADTPTGDSYVQAVNIYKLGLSQSTTPGAAFPIDPGARGLAISGDGTRLFVPYMGTVGPPPVSGGVALVDVTEQDCEEILWRHLNGCPSCEDEVCRCVVLATIENYAPGFALWDMVPPPRADEDKTNKIARINNRTGRRLLPSTQTLLELIECALERAPGGQGKQGPPGDPGPGIDDVVVTIAPCGQQPKKPVFIDGPNGRTLVLELPSELDDLPPVEFQTAKCLDDLSGEFVCEGDKRKLVLRMPRLKDLQVKINPVDCDQQPTGHVEQDSQTGKCLLVLDIPTGCKEVKLPHIVAINWQHADTLLINNPATQRQIAEFRKNGLVIAFDAEMLPETINRHTVQVLFSVYNPDADGYCFCNLQGTVRPGRVITDKHQANLPECGDIIKAFQPHSDADIAARKPATGAQFRPAKEDWFRGQGTEYQVIVKGDFILASDEDPTLVLADGKPGHRALDGNHLGPGLPLRCPTGDGVEGGTFESWFSFFREKPIFMRLDLNAAQPGEILALKGVGPAMLRRIETARKKRPFADLNDFRDRAGLSDRDWERISTDVTVIPRG